MLWQPGKKSPDYEPPFEVKVTNKIAFSAVRETGNTEEDNLDVDFSTAIKGEDYTLGFYANIEREKKKDITTTDDRGAGFDYEKRYTKKNSWYSRGELEKDEEEGVKLRTMLVLGYGHYFITNETTVLRLRAGLARQEIQYDEDSTVTALGLDSSFHFRHKFKNSNKFYSDILYTPDLDNYERNKTYWSF